LKRASAVYGAWHVAREIALRFDAAARHILDNFVKAETRRQMAIRLDIRLMSRNALNQLSLFFAGWTEITW
jgi:preprotein translocase subunit SecD